MPVGSTGPVVVSECADFVGALFGERWPAPMHALLWEKRPAVRGGGGWSTWIASAREADRAVGKPEVYVGAGLVGAKLDGSVRGLAIERCAIPGVWLDVDINGGPEKRARYAPDEDAALDLCRSLGPQPSILVHSGYGIQAWWLFDDVLSWRPGDRRAWEAARDLVIGFWTRASAAAGAAGFMLDATHDLARVMRLPGTMNAKDATSPVPVSWLDQDDGVVRYELGELREIALESPVARRGSTVSVHVGAQDEDRRTELRARTFALLENDDRFRALWERSDNRLVSDTSPSGWCMALAHRAVAAGWEDQWIADLLMEYRRARSDGDKPLRWFELTIAKARDRSVREQVRDVEGEIQQEALETLADLGHQQVVNPSEALAAFNALVPGLQGRELIQQGHDPSVARFWLVLSSEEKVEIGSGRDLLNPDHVAAAIMVVTGYTMMTVKREKWRLAVRGLVKARRHVDSETLADIAHGWLSSYLDSNLADSEEWNEAAYARKPYERNGRVHITLEDFHRYVRRNLGERIEKSEVQARLSDIGFQRATVGCNPPLGRDKGRTSRTYWWIQRERVIRDEEE